MSAYTNGFFDVTRGVNDVVLICVRTTFITRTRFLDGMAKDDKVRMPSSMAGLTTYYDESTSNFVMTPKQVMILIGLIAAVLLTLHLFSPLA